MIDSASAQQMQTPDVAVLIIEYVSSHEDGVNAILVQKHFMDQGFRREQLAAALAYEVSRRDRLELDFDFVLSVPRP